MTVDRTTIRLRCRVLVVLLIVIPLGFALKYYRGPGHWWVNNWGPASVAYEVCFMLLAFLAVPRRSAITPIAIGVCTLTCLLEFLQLWQPPWLQAIRSTLLGAALLGTSFAWWDLPAYVIGCVLGWFLLHGLLSAGKEHTARG